MDLIPHFFVVVTAVGLAYGGVGLLMALRVLGTIPQLDQLQPAEPTRWPALSVLIPACNEAHTLGPAVRARLRSDYPELQFVVVDDRSDDGTTELVDQLAAEDERVTAVHVEQLPAGWLGKVHALQRGLEQATGEWLLLTDADVHVDPGTLRTVVAWAEEQGLDHLGALPHLMRAGPAVDPVVSNFARYVAGGSQPWNIENPESDRAVGVGAFNLVRRSALERVGGFAALKLEIADDMAVAWLVKRAGGETRLINAHRAVRVVFYESLRAMAKHTEKTGWSIIGRYSLLRLLVVCSIVLAVEVGPLVGFLPALAWFGLPGAAALGPAWLPALALASYAVNATTGVVLDRWLGRSGWAALLYPLGTLLLVFMVLRSGALGIKNGGLRWRGTFYATEELKTGMIVTFP